MKITLTDPRTSVTLQPRNFTVTLSGARGPAGQGLPPGGTEGQIIVKQSATDYDTAWADNYATNVELYVKNSTAGAMTKGQVVYVSGADGTNPTITLAQATSEGGSSKTIGVLKQDLAVGALGYVITDGLLEGLNTNSASAAGDTIWLSPTTAGGVVYGDANKPSAPNHMVFIGYVLRKNTNNGKIFVKIQNGFELQELHNVAISSPVTGQVLKYNGTTGLWSNDTDAGGINTLNGLTASTQTFATGTSGTDFGIVSATGTHTFNLPTASASARGLLSSTDWSTFNGKQGALSFDSTPTNGSTNPVTSDGVFDALALKQDVLTNPVTGTGTSGQVSYWTGTGTQGGSANLFWDAVNSRLGVGTSSPSINLQVETNVNTSAGIYTRNTNSGSSAYSFISAANNSSASLEIRSHSSSHNVWPNWGMLSTSSGLTGGLVLFASGNAPMAFWTNTVERMRIFGGGNISIGTSSDLSARLGIRGSGTTSSTTALLVQNGTPTRMFEILDNGLIRLGSNSNTGIVVNNNATNTPDLAGVSIRFNHAVTTESQNGFTFKSFFDSMTGTSGTQNNAAFTQGFRPTSGTAQFNQVSINFTVDQTGGANGITRGLFVTPNLVSAADWRSIEWSNNTGWGLYGAGTANNYLAGSLGIGTTSVAGYNLRVSKSITGASTVRGIMSQGDIQSDVTGSARYYESVSSIQSGVTVPEIYHHFVNQGTFAGTVSAQYGYYVSSALTGATSNFGFRSDIAAATGRWNLYMNGTAANYIAGDTAIGTTTTSGGRLTVRGSGTTSATTALLVQNSTPTTLLQVLDNGRINQTLEGSASSTAFGTGALSVATGANNVALGFNAGFSNSTGASNSFFGRSAGQANTSASNNSFFGRSAGFNNSTGASNSFFGANSGFANTNGSNNSFFGVNAGYYITGGVITNTIANNSIFIGYDTRANADNETNQIVIGYQTTGLGSNTTNIGNASTTQTNLYGNLTIGTTTSGGRLTVRGSGTTSSTTALLVQNGTPTNLFSITDNGQVNYTPVGLTGSEATSAIDIQQTWNTTGTPTLIKANVTDTASNANSLLMDLRVGNTPRFQVLKNGRIILANLATIRTVGITATDATLLYTSGIGSGSGNDHEFSNGQVGTNRNHTSGTSSTIYIPMGYAPTSGNGGYIGFHYNGTINQTGGANGITRGLYVNPTLTAAADWRGIESVAASNANHTLLKLRNATVDVFTVKADSKIGFWNATPVAQPTTAIAEATFTENSGGTAVNVDSTFAGYTLQQIAQALKDIGILQ